MSGLAFPKPTRAPKELKRLRQVSAKRAARIAAGEERPGLKRSFMKRTPPRRLETDDPGRLEFARAGVCVCRMLEGHACRGANQASHERNPQGGMPTGTARKENARLTCTMCEGGHLDEWERRDGVFKGWTNEERHDFMAARCAELNAEWDALESEQREWWQQHAAVMAKRRAEARRAS